MLKCASVYTFEIDDPEIAIEEIRAQLNKKITFLEHTVGIVMCHPEFIASGVLKHVCENLPFNLAGTTTSSQAIDGEIGELILTIFVMTSDDVWFKTGVTESLSENIDAQIKAAFDKSVLGVSESPKLALTFPPQSLRAGDAYVNAWQEIIPNVPVFGPVAVDDTLTFEESETIHNGESYKAAMPFVLCYGNITPRFIVGTLPQDKAMPYKGEITKSNEAFVYEVNNMNARQYFESIGFVNSYENYIFAPLVIDQKKRTDYDGIPVLRILASFTADGAAIFRGYVDEGSIFTILTCETEDMLSATRQTIEQLNDLPDVNGALLFPCIVRRMMTMRENPMMELETVRDTINPDIPFMIGYAGGEISPTLIKNDIPTNRFHNYSLVILVV